MSLTRANTSSDSQWHWLMPSSSINLFGYGSMYWSDWMSGVGNLFGYRFWYKSIANTLILFFWQVGSVWQVVWQVWQYVGMFYLNSYNIFTILYLTLYSPSKGLSAITLHIYFGITTRKASSIYSLCCAVYEQPLGSFSFQIVLSMCSNICHK